MKKLALSVLFCSVVFEISYAQFIENVRGSISVGTHHLNIEKFPQNESLDYMNFSLGNNEDIYFNFSVLFELRNNLDFNLKTYIGSNLKPYNFTFKTQYTPFKYLGFLAGYYYENNYFDDFSKFHKSQSADYYIIGNYYYLYKLHSNNVFAGVYFPISLNRLQSKFELIGGANLTNKLNIPIFEKRKNGNELHKIEYHIQPNSTWFIEPSVELTYDLFHTKHSTIGVIGNFSTLFSEKSLKYDKITYNWTYHDKNFDKIDSPTHAVNNVKWDLGVFVRW